MSYFLVDEKHKIQDGRFIKSDTNPQQGDIIEILLDKKEVYTYRVKRIIWHAIGDSLSPNPNPNPIRVLEAEKKRIRLN